MQTVAACCKSLNTPWKTKARKKCLVASTTGCTTLTPLWSGRPQICWPGQSLLVWAEKLQKVLSSKNLRIRRDLLNALLHDFINMCLCCQKNSQNEMILNSLLGACKCLSKVSCPQHSKLIPGVWTWTNQVWRAFLICLVINIFPFFPPCFCTFQTRGYGEIDFVPQN